MEITKTVTKKVYIEPACNSVDFGMTFGKFVEIRNKSNLPINHFDKCFICGHRFENDEVPNIVKVSGEGNSFSCDDCYKKLESEDK